MLELPSIVCAARNIYSLKRMWRMFYLINVNYSANRTFKEEKNAISNVDVYGGEGRSVFITFKFI